MFMRTFTRVGEPSSLALITQNLFSTEHLLIKYWRHLGLVEGAMSRYFPCVTRSFAFTDLITRVPSILNGSDDSAVAQESGVMKKSNPDYGTRLIRQEVREDDDPWL